MLKVALDSLSHYYGQQTINNSDDSDLRAKMMCRFTSPQRKADDPKARPTRNQLGLVGSGFELVKTDLDPADKTKLVLKNVQFECHIRFPERLWQWN